MTALERALHGLRTLIADGDLTPGEKLPSEEELGTRLGVSRGPVREAIRTLSALGVLETRRGSGSYVGRLNAADMIQSLSLTVGLLPLEGVLELVEMRRALESHAAAQAAARIEAGDLHDLDLLLSQIEATTDEDAYSRLDHRFHMRVTRIGGNDAVSSLLEVIRSRSRAYRVDNKEDALMVKTLSDAGHRAILRALQAHDPVAASAAASGHVAQTEYWLRKYPQGPLPLPRTGEDQ